MKKMIMMLMFCLILSLAGCGDKHEQATDSGDETSKATATTETTEAAETAEAKEGTEETGETKVTLDGLPEDEKRKLEEKIEEIENDFDTTIDSLTSQLKTAKDTIGDTYDGYIENKEVLADWYNAVAEEGRSLYERTENNSIEYYRIAADVVESGDLDTMDSVMQYYYDIVSETLYENFYDSYESSFDDIYNNVYEGVIKSAQEQEDYGEWLDVYSDAYSDWLDAKSDAYSAWLDSESDMYSLWLDVGSDFYSSDFDVESTITEYLKEKEDSETVEETTEEIVEETTEEITEETTEAETESEAATETEGSDEVKTADLDDDSIRPEFKETMDKYEAFFDEYAEFMAKFHNTENTASMLADYTEYLTKYTEAMESISKLGNEKMSKAEALYYAEVTLRIEQKMLEVSSEMQEGGSE